MQMADSGDSGPRPRAERLLPSQSTAHAAAPKQQRLPPAFGPVFLLLAASQSLPLTANVTLIYRQMHVSTAQASAYFLAEFMPSFAAPVFGWLTDRGGPRVRWWTVVVALVAKAVAVAGFAAGAVRGLGSLYALGVLMALAHAVALATVDGAMCARGSDGASGDTSAARSRQAAKLLQEESVAVQLAYISCTGEAMAKAGSSLILGNDPSSMGSMLLANPEIFKKKSAW